MGNNLKTTLSLVVVSVLISMYVYYFEQDAPDWEPKAYYSNLLSRDIVEMEFIPGSAILATKKEKPVRVLLRHQRLTEKDLPRWHIVEPVAFEVFFPKVEGILRALHELRTLGPVSPEDVEASFGDQTFMTIRFKTRDGVERRLEIGRPHPIENMDLVAVRADGEDAFHTVGGFKRSLDVTLEGLRSRALIPVPAEKMVRVEVQRPGEGTGFTLERQVGSVEWRFQAPHAGVADPELVLELLNGLNSWRIETFVENSVEDPNEYGFDEPRMIFSLTERKGDGAGREFRYEIADDPGDTLETHEVYVRDPRRSFVFSSRSDVVAELERPAEELRNRYLLSLGASRIVEVGAAVRNSLDDDRSMRRFRVWDAEEELTDARPGMPKEHGEFVGWKVQDDHLDRRFRADRSVTSSVVLGLSRFPIARYMDDPSHPVVQSLRDGQLSVALELEIQTETTLKRTLKFYPVPEGKDFNANSFLVERDGTDEIVLVNTLLHEDLSAGGIYFRDRNISGIDSASVQSFEVWNSSGRVWSLARIGDSWRVGETDSVTMLPGKGLDETLVNAAVRGLSQGFFRVEGFLPDAKDEAQLEIVPGRWLAMIHLTEVAHAEGFTRVIVGARRERSPGQEYYGKLDSVPDMPVLLANDLVGRFIELVDHLESVTKRP